MSVPSQLRTSTKRKQKEPEMDAGGSDEETGGMSMSHVKSRKLSHTVTSAATQLAESSTPDSEQVHQELDLPEHISTTAVIGAATSTELANPKKWPIFMKRTGRVGSVPITRSNPTTPTNIWCLKIVEVSHDCRDSYQTSSVQFFYSEADAQQALLRKKQELMDYKVESDSDSNQEDDNEPEPLLDVYSLHPTQPYEFHSTMKKVQFDAEEFERQFAADYETSGHAYYEKSSFESDIFLVQVKGKPPLPAPAPVPVSGVHYEQRSIQTFFRANK